MKNLLLCADDFAQNIFISEGILKLAKKSKLNTISCMVTSPLWAELQQELTPLRASTYIGLHFNLTHGRPLSTLWQDHYGPQFSGLSDLLKKCYLRTLHLATLESEIKAQLEAFTITLGMAPDFIDGHQHVHQLPIIRESLLRIHQQEQLPSFLRSTSNGWRDFASLKGAPKRQCIPLLGGIRFKHLLETLKIPTNTSFAGIYNFKHGQDYREYFKEFLTISQDGGLIMCHPGMTSTDKDDPLYQNRVYEFDYFMSAQYTMDLNERSFQLRRKP